MKKAPIFLWLMLSGAAAWGQLLDQRVTLQYADATVSEVLHGISQGYGTRFAYSSDFVPVHRRVSVQAHNETLRQVLDRMFEDQPVQYAAINGQVVLKADRSRKAEPVGQLEKPRIRPVQTSPLYPQELSKEELLALNRQREHWAQMAAIEQRRLQRIEGSSRSMPPPPPAPLAEQETPLHRLAQVSLLPLIGTNALSSAQITNDLSLNVLWGINGGVSGVEVGGFGNTVLGDVSGLQIAGIGSIVEGDVTGTQIGGLFNLGPGRVHGLQLAGLFNISGDAEAVQASGLFNIARGNMNGVQAAGLFNIAAGDAYGYQGSGLFNISGGNTHAQTAALFNVAGDVRNVQASVLFNRARKVEGFQFGIVNIADTVAGAPVGLFNFIRKGYNRAELSSSELLYANLGVKFGAHAFYNIIQAGVRWESWRSNHIKGLSWGIGYGIGAAKALNSRLGVNTEIVAMHINEEERWTHPLNLLGQFKLSFDLRAGPHLSLFGGPVANLMVSRRFNADTGQYGSGLPPRSFWEGEIGAARANAWIGFTAGIRI